MMACTYSFAVNRAFELVFHNLSSYQAYGCESPEDLFELITGDTAWDNLPEALREDVGSVDDLFNLSSDLRERLSDVVWVLRTLNTTDYVKIIDGVMEGL